MFADNWLRMQVDGGLSRAWQGSGIGPGRNLLPFLFNLIIDSLASAVRAACLGVALGSDASAPRVSILPNETDLVIQSTLKIPNVA